MGEGFKRDVHPLYKHFWFLTSFFKIQKDFLTELSKLFQASLFQNFYFSDEWKVVSWHPKGGCTPSIKSLGVFSDILATASKLNTLYELETFHIHSSRHVIYIEKVLRHIQHFVVLMTSSILGFYIVLQFLATASDI